MTPPLPLLEEGGPPTPGEERLKKGYKVPPLFFLSPHSLEGPTFWEKPKKRWLPKLTLQTPTKWPKILKPNEEVGFERGPLNALDG